MRIPLISQTYTEYWINFALNNFFFNTNKSKNVDKKQTHLNSSSIWRNVLEILQLGPSNGGI